MCFNTRIAPSPTGSFHIGTARTAYFNWLAARSTGGQFILRIDNTDEKRNKQEYIDIILEAIEWLGLDYDQLVYQSERFEKHVQMAHELIKQGKAKEIDGGAIVLVPDHLPSSFRDEIIGPINISQDDKDHCQNLVLIRSGGKIPTYQWSCVVDDIDFNINYIIRGVDHVTNTSRQVAIYSTLKSNIPKFAHVGLIQLNKKKLSKRDGVSSVLAYKEEGYSPEAILNFILRLGWSVNPDNKSTAIIDKDMALDLFMKNKMRAAPSNMDMAKLKWYNNKYKSKVLV